MRDDLEEGNLGDDEQEAEPASDPREAEGNFSEDESAEAQDYWKLTRDLLIRYHVRLKW